MMRHLSKAGNFQGLSVMMSDGWRGRVLHYDGETVVCLRNGEQPNDWLRGYRAFDRRLLSVSGGKAIVDWNSRIADLAASAGCQRADHLERLAEEWTSAPPD